jgi:hypothetical protein
LPPTYPSTPAGSTSPHRSRRTSLPNLTQKGRHCSRPFAHSRGPFPSAGMDAGSAHHLRFDVLNLLHCVLPSVGVIGEQ